MLHEMVHTIQHDGFGSEPWWLIESMADFVRLQAHLGPPHWRVPGQGRTERGWEEGYDSGARFLAWLTGWEQNGATPGSRDLGQARGDEAFDHTAPTRTAFSAAQPTQYPSGAPPPAPPQHSRPPTGSRPRRPPNPDLVRMLDHRLAQEKWDDQWWEQMAGARLEVLWAEYLEYYR